MSSFSFVDLGKHNNPRRTPGYFPLTPELKFRVALGVLSLPFVMFVFNGAWENLCNLFLLLYAACLPYKKK